MAKCGGELEAFEEGTLSQKCRGAIKGPDALEHRGHMGRFLQGFLGANPSFPFPVPRPRDATCPRPHAEGEIGPGASPTSRPHAPSAVLHFFPAHTRGIHVLTCIPSDNMASTYALPPRPVSHNHADHDHAQSHPPPDSPYALKSYMNGRANGRGDTGRSSQGQGHRHKRNVSINFGFAPIQEKEATTAPPPEYVDRG